MTPDAWVLPLAFGPFLLALGLVALALVAAPLTRSDPRPDTSRGTRPVARG